MQKISGLSLFLILFANSTRLENYLSDLTEVGGIEFRARNNFSRLTGTSFGINRDLKCNLKSAFF
jgi:hypothetical protein